MSPQPVSGCCSVLLLHVLLIRCSLRAARVLLRAAQVLLRCFLRAALSANAPAHASLQLHLPAISAMLDLGCLSEPSFARAGGPPSTAVSGGISPRLPSPVPRRDIEDAGGSPGNPSSHPNFLHLPTSLCKLLACCRFARTWPSSTCCRELRSSDSTPTRRSWPPCPCETGSRILDRSRSASGKCSPGTSDPVA